MMTSTIPILMYHQIDIPQPGTRLRGLCVHPHSFRRQMGTLKRLGYEVLSLSRLLPCLQGERQGKVIGLTFDDGYRNACDHALPVLVRHGFSATCYVVSKAIGQYNAWDADKGIAPVPLMDRDHIRQWLAAGMEIGSHTLTHVDLTACPDMEARSQIHDSKRHLEDGFGVAVPHFCYPYGAYNPQVRHIVAEAGYRTATTIQRGRAHYTDDLLELPRVAVYYSTWLYLFWLKLNSSYEDRRRK